MELKITMPDTVWAASITIVTSNGKGGQTVFTHGFDPHNHNNLEFEWEDKTELRLKAENVKRKR